MQRKIEISEELWLRVEQSSGYQGYSSPHQYVADVLEKELARSAAVSDQEVTRKMEELGYLDFGRDI